MPKNDPRLKVNEQLDILLVISSQTYTVLADGYPQARGSSTFRTLRLVVLRLLIGDNYDDSCYREETNCYSHGAVGTISTAKHYGCYACWSMLAPAYLVFTPWIPPKRFAYCIQFLRV